MRIGAVILVVGVGAFAGLLARSASSAPTLIVRCGEIIHHTAFPYLGDRRPRFRYRLVLGVVSAPPTYLQQVIPTHRHPWAYWYKSGLVVRAGSESVTVSVPRAWRSRVAITWGNNTGIVHTLRIAGCGSDPSVGNAYAGGFYLRSSSACVPLIFGVGKRSATVRFGVGRTCPS